MPEATAFEAFSASAPSAAVAARLAQASPTGPQGSIYGQPVPEPASKAFRNVDGERFEDGRYAKFKADALSSGAVQPLNVFEDPVRTFAYGTDASFYRLIPKMVLKFETEDEIRKLLPLAVKHATPVTFRAAGTSLSGQAVSDSILLKLSHTGKKWRRHAIADEGRTVTVEPGLIGGEVNRLLGAYAKKGGHAKQYRLGPDPASIDSCMIGGIVANNSSGMCCGVLQNTYHTLKDLRVVFVDGTVLDTSDAASVADFKASPFGKELCEGVTALAREVQADAALTKLITRKFGIKCTTGYSINALVDNAPENSINIIKQLMVGSEGTLGFVSRATYNTVEELPFKASTFVLYPSFHEAGRATVALRGSGCVDAVEVFDRASLHEAEKDDKMVKLVPGLTGCHKPCAGLLIEVRGETQAILDDRIRQSMAALHEASIDVVAKDGRRCAKPETLECNFPFRHDPKESEVFWNMRKGLIPMVGAQRTRGTSMLIEDVACDVTKLADMSVDLIEMFQRHGYTDASVFGHAMEGNMHLVFSQGFRDDKDIKKFADMMQEMCEIVAVKYDGSLKGEHGTGRNVAAFVEMEWGAQATAFMWRLKALFDKDFILNPGVLLNADPHLHLKNLKPSPLAHDLVDACIECGFCESNCPSRDAALTPRQRITVWREINRLARVQTETPQIFTSADAVRLEAMRAEYEYVGLDMCAADGMCQEKCPVKINTGELVKTIREAKLRTATPVANTMSNAVVRHFRYFDVVTPPILDAVSLAHRILGTTVVQTIASLVHKVGGGFIPLWNPHMPSGARPLPDLAAMPPVPGAVPMKAAAFASKVVYVPACVTRVMGATASDPEQRSVPERFVSLMNKAGCEVVYPDAVREQCCGLMFHSRGCVDASDMAMEKLEAALLKASDNGRHPIVCDTSPCLKHIKDHVKSPLLKFAIFEPVEFIGTFLKDRLDFEQKAGAVAVHVPCSSKKMKLEGAFEALVRKCATDVVHSGVPCCGMAGERGMRFPELTGAALQHLEIPANVTGAYSTSRTCECALSNQSDVHFRSVLHLLDDCATPSAKQSAKIA
ncbi:glycolate dehydrogenase [Pelagophyceae sp. CCMP2097]|nr:glycolate dehydrogenase [Pelagophyceae sp. CCMP2097]